MIGVVGRLAGSQIGRQIGREALANIGGGGLRQVATQELERLMQNPQIQEAFTREQLRIMMKKLGRAGLASLLSTMLFGDATDDEKEDDDASPEARELRDPQFENRNDRMENFGNQIRGHLNHNRTIYAEERDVFNKNTIEDRKGLNNAYASPTGLYRTGNTLYISGTGGKDGSFVRDWMDNLGKLPFRNAHKTEKYKDVMKELKKSPDVTRLVSHSLASAVVNTINQDQPNKYATTTYATPTKKPKRKGKQNPHHKDFRNPHDVVSALDGYAITSDFDETNPIRAHGFNNFSGIGHFDMHPSTAVSNGFNPNNV